MLEKLVNYIQKNETKSTNDAPKLTQNVLKS